MNRRQLVRAGLGLAAASASGFAFPQAPPPSLVTLREGGFAYLPESGFPFSVGVVAISGFVLHRVHLRNPLPMEEGFAFLAGFLKTERRPLAALAGCELRIPARLTRPEFGDFNKRYLSALQAHGFSAGDRAPIARSNMAPQFHPPASAVLTAFTFATPISGGRKTGGPDFLVSGSPENESNPNRVVAPGDISPHGMQQKAACVLDKLRKAVGQMGARWNDITACQIYTMQPLEGVMDVLQSAGLTGVGLSLFPGYIPVVGFEGFNYEFEADVRSITVERSI